MCCVSLKHEPYIMLGCTTRGPHAGSGPELVISGPLSRLKVQETYRDFMKEFKHRRINNSFATY